MGLILPSSAFRDLHARVGFIPLRECSGDEPNFSEAKDLDQTLRAYDYRLEVGFLRNRDENRWAVRQKNADGSEILVRTIETSQGDYERPSERDCQDLMAHNLHGPNGREVMRKLREGDEIRDAADAKAKEAETEVVAEGIAKRLRDFGDSQREEGDPLMVSMADRRGNRRAPSPASRR